MAHCLASTPRSWTLSRSPPHKHLQQIATTTRQRPWGCHSGCKRSSIRSFQTLRPLDAWVTNRFSGAGTSKAQGHGVKLLLHCGYLNLRVENTRIVWSVSDRETLRNEGLAGGWGRWVGYERRDCWGCQQHINTHLSAGGDIWPCRHSLPPRFFFSLFQ